MKALNLLLACAALFPFAARADNPAATPPAAVAHDDDWLSASQIETLQNWGWVTPEFQGAATKLIDARQSGQTAQDEVDKLTADRPGLEKSVAEEDGKVAQLKADLARYDHPDETDFTALQDAMKNTTAKTEDQEALAQAYVWTYPASPHAAEAEHDLQQLEKKIADQVQTTREDEAAKLAAQAKLLQRVQAHNLSLAEWRAFLQDKSEAEVTQYLGQPSSQKGEYLIYSGSWTTDPSTGQKAGLQLNFNGGRVLSVAPVTGP
jgi:hypothetical protein